MKKYRESGTDYTFVFTPVAGMTYSAEFDLYKPFESGPGGFSNSARHGSIWPSNYVSA